MTPGEVKAARHSFGLTASGFAQLMRMRGANAERTVRRWEDGSQDIPGYVTLVVEILVAVPAVRKLLGISINGIR